MAGQYKYPIRRSLMIGCSLFITALCVALILASYVQSSRLIYSQYDIRLANALNYVETQLDADDLEKCYNTGVPSAKYKQEQQFLNGFIDPIGLDYLYIVVPSEEGMINMISATNDAERAAGDADLAIKETSDAYSQEELQRYMSYWDAKKINYFEENSDWGRCYTAVKPLHNSKHETIALMCADVFVDNVAHQVGFYVMVNILLTIAISLIFAIALMLWLRRNIIRPIRDLEESTRNFASSSHQLKEDAAMKPYIPPDIRTENEVQSLSEAITKMSDDMREYVLGILNAEARAENAEQEAENMTMIAFQDALTHVKSKAAYNQMIEDLTEEINRGEKPEFAILMLDLNDLKKINDTYGHEKGDEYIIGSCALICEIYDHSPVYRIGGDEFAVLLRGRDYEERAALYIELNRRFTDSRTDMKRQPWERYSTASGMAKYGGKEGETAEDVFRLADERMYKDKQHMKAQGLVAEH